MGKFELGTLVTTCGISERMEREGAFRHFVYNSVDRYISGDWGDTCADDKMSNDEALDKGYRILAVYIYPDDATKNWIITEWDRSVTTILYPDEY